MEKDQENNEIIDAEFEETSIALREGPTSVATFKDLSTPEKMQAALTQMKNALEFKQQTIILALQIAPKGSIDYLGDKPVVSEAACEGIFSMLGGGEISPPEIKIIKDDDGSGHWGVMATCTIEHSVFGKFGGVGFAHTSDQFLGETQKRIWNDKTRKKEPVFDDDGNPVMSRTIAQVSKHNLIQHAYTRSKGNALRKLLGIAKLTDEQLSEWGVSVSGAKVNYNGKGSKPKTAGGSLKNDICRFVNEKIFTFGEIGEFQREIGLSKSKALELSTPDQKKLIKKLNEEEKKKNGGDDQ